MVLKNLIDKISGKSDRGPWQPEAGPFPRLMLIDEPSITALQKKGGLFALWHQGIRPQWIYLGYAHDLSIVIRAAQEDPDIILYDRNDGVFLAWAECAPKHQIGAVLHLRALCNPALDSSTLEEFGPISPDTQPIEFPPPVD